MRTIHEMPPLARLSAAATLAAGALLMNACDYEYGGSQPALTVYAGATLRPTATSDASCGNVPHEVGGVRPTKFNVPDDIDRNDEKVKKLESQQKLPWADAVEFKVADLGIKPGDLTAPCGGREKSMWVRAHATNLDKVR
jgi:hypothetical protein